MESKSRLEAKCTQLKDQLIDAKTQNYRLAMNNFISPERSPEYRQNERSLNADFLRMSALEADSISKNSLEAHPANINHNSRASMRTSLRFGSVSLEGEQATSPQIRQSSKTRENKSSYHTVDAHIRKASPTVMQIGAERGSRDMSRNGFAKPCATDGYQKYVNNAMDIKKAKKTHKKAFGNVF